MDATPLLGVQTGVAAFCRGAMTALASRPELDVGAFAVSWRRRRAMVAQLPEGVAAIGRPMPARPLHRAWRVGPLPPIEWLTGPTDVVHGTNFVVPPARRAAQVVTVHDLTAVLFPEMCEPVSRSFPALVRRAVARGAWVHTPSAWVAAEVVDLLGVDPDRVRAVHHGVPPGPTGESPPGSDLAPGVPLPPGTRRYVLALGTVEPRKDLPGLVRAFGQIGADHPDVALVLAGADGWGAADLDAAVAASPMGRRILRTGYVAPDRRDRLLAGATVFAYPSRYEGFGFPPLEAMMAGVPVVATKAGALPEVLGEGAELVAVGDTVALAHSLSRLLGDDSARQDLVARGRHRVAALDWQDCAAGLARLYADAWAARAVAGGRR